MRTFHYNWNTHRRSGFTLIEILIVIVIVGLLAALAVSSFGVARQHARLDIAADTLVSVFKQQQDQARVGRQLSGSEHSSCYGIVFNTDDSAPPAIQTVVVPYQPASTNSANRNADYCDTNSDTTQRTAIAEDIVVKSFSAGTQDLTNRSNLVVFFKPPFATPVIAYDLVGISEPSSDPVAFWSPVRVVISLKDDPNGDQRGISFDPISGSFGTFQSS